MTSPSRPKWDCRDLKSHYQKHAVREFPDCWKDITGSPTPVSLPVYERASYDAWNSKPSLRFTCEYNEAHRSDRDQWRSFTSHVDRRGIRVIVDDKSQSIKTCYHLHRPLREHVSPSLFLPEQLLEMLKANLQDEVGRGHERKHRPPIEEIKWPQ